MSHQSSLALAVGAVAVVTIGIAVARAQTARTQKQEIEDLEKSREEAVINHDTSRLCQLYADGMTVVDIAGELHVNQNDSAAALNAPSTRAVKEWQADEVTVRVYGAAAIVTERAHITDVLKGQPRSFTARLTHVWIKLQDRWQLVARQATEIAPSR